MELPRDLKLLIFDFDGTLHDLDLDWQAVRQAVGIDTTGEKLGDAIDRLKAEGNSTALQSITNLELQSSDQKSLSPEITAALKSLMTKYKVAIVSRNSRLAIEHILSNSGLEDIFIIGREDVSKLKPNPDGINRILQHFTVTADQAALVGDTNHDVAAAHNAGLASVIVGSNFKQLDGLRPSARCVDLPELEKILNNTF